MRAREFIKEATPTTNKQQNIGVGAAQGLAAMSGAASTPKVNVVPGAQPKPMTVTATTQQTSNSTSGTVGSTGSTTQPNNTEVGQEPLAGQKVPPQNLQQQQAAAQQTQNQMGNDAAVMAQRMGMNPTQTQQFSQKVLGTGSLSGPSTQKKISPQDMQRAMPKPGANLSVKTIGQARVLPTPSDEKGVKLDTTKKLGYPILVDPRDLQQ